MSEQKDKIAIQFRCDPEYNERLERHANTPVYERSKAHYARRATTLLMEMEDALGAQFDHVISELLESTDVKEAA